MKCVFNANQNKHYPKSYLVNGERELNPESPQRVELLLAGAVAAGMTQVEPDSYPIDSILKVHPQRYLTFLESAAGRWSHM